MDGTAVAVYPVIGDTPLLTEAAKLTRPVGETIRFVGGLGAKSALNVTGRDAAEVP